MSTAVLKESDILKAFLILVLGGAISGFVGGAIAGMLVALYHSMTGGTMADIKAGAPIAGGVAGFLISYFVFRFVLRRFLLPRLELPPPTAPAPNAV